MSKTSYMGILKQLRNTIAKLKKKDSVTQWKNYSLNNTYNSEEEKNKIKIVEAFARKYNFDFMADLGCNDGLYSFSSLKGGVKNVIGFDFDLNALNKAYLIAKKEKLNFQTVYMDASNPSPNQGWNENERKSMSKRFRFDGMWRCCKHQCI